MAGVALADRVVGGPGTARRGETASARHAASGVDAAPVERAQADGQGAFAPGGQLAPSATDPLRVLVVGDSLGIDLGQALAPMLQASALATVTVDAQGSTGLARPDYFDWPAHLRHDLAVLAPQVVVILLGANDVQNPTGTPGPVSFGSPAWAALYGHRVATMVAEANGAGARVLWVGAPPMAPTGLDAGIRQIDAVVARVVGQGTGDLYLPAGSVLGDPGGGFTATVDGPTGPVAIRTADGIHLTGAGGGLLAAAVVRAMDQSWHLDLPT